MLEFEKNPSQPFAATTGELARHGNGSLMRLCPAPLSAAQAPLEAVQRAVDSSRTTHGSHLAIDCCRYFTSLLVGCLAGASKAELLSPNYTARTHLLLPLRPIHHARARIIAGLPADYWAANPLAPEVDALAKGAYKSKSPPEIRGTGHVVNTLEAVLWAFHSSEDFATGALRVVNLGEDADTTGAVYGQLAGCFYGEEAIPAAWRSQSALSRFISLMGDEIYRLSQLKVPHFFQQTQIAERNTERRDLLAIGCLYSSALDFPCGTDRVRAAPPSPRARPSDVPFRGGVQHRRAGLLEGAE